ncbi:metallopeptidase family protein [Brevibacterium luteolum]|uniref:metallopeptidase family protein n=1 Tax=Brevibacterium luteolum TaxID=199591 RepID=UPI00223BE31A|nr:metallopeptidase family protein [Brevibacterium luteolum]MCT1657461.1 metallopeptidase family protein [Brevibacterium luteolum]
MTCGHPEHAGSGEHESLEPIDDATFEALYAIFDDLVDEVMGELPEGVLDYMDNVVLFAEDEPPPEEPDILGVYDGIPLTERGDPWAFVPPDVIFLYRINLIEFSRTAERLREEILTTIVHEIAHHHGIDDQRLHELGWG